MKFSEQTPPRVFKVGAPNEISIKDCAHIELETHEQITLKTPSGSEVDIVRFPWGYYATPSLNVRLKSFGIRTVLVKSREKRYYILLVEKGKESQMEKYFLEQGHKIVCWLDDDQALEDLDRAVGGKA